jgi:predicted permease
MHDIEPGYRTEDVLRFGLTLPEATYPEATDVTQFFRELEGRIRALPQVASVGAAYRLPLGGGGSNGSVHVEDRPEVPGERTPATYPRPTTPGYLRTMGIPVIRGRELLASDNEESLRVALVNETFVAENFPGEDPVGKRFYVGVTYGFGSPTWTIVGIVPDIQSVSLTEDPVSEIFVPFAQMPAQHMSFAVRSVRETPSLLPAIRAEVQAMDPDLPLRSVSTMEEAVSGETAATRFYLSLLVVFAGLAVILAAVGLYGVVSYLVSLRRQEVGIRIALGADRSGILRMFVRQAAMPTLTGILLGVAIALVGASTLEEFLYQVNPRDPLVFGGVLLVPCPCLSVEALRGIAGRLADPDVTP